MGADGTKGEGGANALTPEVIDGAMGRPIGALGRANELEVATGEVIARGFMIEGIDNANGDLIAAGA